MNFWPSYRRKRSCTARGGSSRHWGRCCLPEIRAQAGERLGELEGSQPPERYSPSLKLSDVMGVPLGPLRAPREAAYLAGGGWSRKES